ncbi:hypothetical protein Q4574_07710 [Aliiglaciecola sp. 3_MG-2023]|uniref:hypothetical protein n=1 Tax=Aliiglaciecola sp. 3_MG-2023 TaxID=3062644 RepID=UPI0026E23134|nr:hypothetical protein [Aliiglaciecola sp. 3_MG-2023]MDO6693167.1 hypothetical protein [Aliiglaciecola sp. 3_MG-2023]
MSKNIKKTKEIQLDDSLINSAIAYFDRLPRSPTEVIENWAEIGRAAAEQLTEEELMNLQLRNKEVKITVVSKT